MTSPIHHPASLITMHTPITSTSRHRSRLALPLRITAMLSLVLLSQCSQKDDSTLRFTGILDATTTRVSAQNAGLVTRLLVDEGRLVSPGDTLAVIEASKLGYQIEQSEAQTVELERQKESARAQLRAATINRENLRLRLDRFTALLRSGATTQQSVDDLKAALDAADEQLTAARLALEALTEKQAQLASGRKIVQTQIRDAVVASPLAGAVLVTYTEPGEFLTPGGPVCEIADLTDMWTKIYVAEEQLPFITMGQKVQVQVDGMPDRSFEGTVSWISPRAEFTPKTILTEETRTMLVFQARIRIPNNDGVFKIGMPVSVILQKAR